VTYFEKYGQQYNLDPLMLAAQGFQESQLNQDAKSRVGAVGIMQLMPATGKQLYVGNIRIAESNIHAGAKYLDQLTSACWSTFSRDGGQSEQDHFCCEGGLAHRRPRRCDLGRQVRTLIVHHAISSTRQLT
jgi:hypothetical protein